MVCQVCAQPIRQDGEDGWEHAGPWPGDGEADHPAFPARDPITGPQAEEAELVHERAHAGVSEPDDCDRGPACPANQPADLQEVLNAAVADGTLPASRHRSLVERLRGSGQAGFIRIDGVLR